jgi:protein-S-isoprenylcysteine O-methyltransferase Ste14
LLSLGLYLLGVAVAFTEPWISVGLYVAVAIVWFVPDRRFEERA